MNTETEIKNETKVKVPIEQDVNNVVVADVFALCKSPAAFQLTIHVNNLIQTYDKTNIIKAFKGYLKNPETLLTDMSEVRIRAIINHYGIPTCQKWFTDIYGWNFTKKVA